MRQDLDPRALLFFSFIRKVAAKNRTHTLVLHNDIDTEPPWRAHSLLVDLVSELNGLVLYMAVFFFF